MFQADFRGGKDHQRGQFFVFALKSTFRCVPCRSALVAFVLCSFFYFVPPRWAGRPRRDYFGHHGGQMHHSQRRRCCQGAQHLAVRIQPTDLVTTNIVMNQSKLRCILIEQIQPLGDHCSMDCSAGRHTKPRTRFQSPRSKNMVKQESIMVVLYINV